MSLIPVSEALARLLDGVVPLPGEEVPLSEAAGRVLAEPIAALRTHPPFNASAMDGYAVRSADLAEIPAVLRNVGEVAAGHDLARTIGAGECARIFTGAPLPPGADAILIQENAERMPDGQVRALESVKPGRHIRPLGQDFSAGDPLLPAGRRMDPAALSLAAAANHAHLQVVRRPLAAILTTGDELLPPGSRTGPGQIIASNAYGVAAMVSECGGRSLDLGIAPDCRDAIAAGIREGIDAGADIIITLGGASVGDHDHVGPVLAELGVDLSFWRIAMRPGKPLMAGRLDGRHVLGLPGNPASALVAAQVFLVPLVARLAARSDDSNRLQPARLGSAMEGNGNRQAYVRARITGRPGDLVATAFPQQDSSMLGVLAAANGLIVRPPNAPEAMQGEPCNIMLLRSSEPENMSD